MLLATVASALPSNQFQRSIGHPRVTPKLLVFCSRICQLLFHAFVNGLTLIYISKLSTSL